MKPILLFIIALFAFVMRVNAQITLEHTYDSASTFTTTDQYYNSIDRQLLIVKFEISGERYVRINRVGKNIFVYDMNHSLLKTISLAGFPMGGSNKMGEVLYLSESLFDKDDGMEFMYGIVEGTDSYTGIYNEDGSLIFSDNACGPLIHINVPLQQYPIYNTSQGTKMILSYTNGEANVFNLPGTLSTAIAEANGQLMQVQGGQGQFSGLYPNPSVDGRVTLQYELPKGEQNGEIILYNMQGAEVKRYKVDGTFNDVVLDYTQLQAGTYFYQLVTAKGAVGTKKMIVVK